MDHGDVAWMLTSSALVLIMTPGLAFFYGGLVKRKNVTIQSPTTNNRHTLQRRLNCKEGTYAVLESCTCI